MWHVNFFKFFTTMIYSKIYLIIINLHSTLVPETELDCTTELPLRSFLSVRPQCFLKLKHDWMFYPVTGAKTWCVVRGK